MDKNEFLAEIEKNILLEDKEKNFWRENFAKMPARMVSFFYLLLKKQNKLTDMYMNAAIEHDETLLPKLNEKIKKMQKEINNLFHGEEEENADKFLEEQLNS